MLARMIPYSFLDLVPVIRGGTVAGALANAADLARHAEALGFHRYWVAEHHGMEGIASAATAAAFFLGDAGDQPVAQFDVVLPDPTDLEDRRRKPPADLAAGGGGLDAQAVVTIGVGDGAGADGINLGELVEAVVG